MRSNFKCITIIVCLATLSLCCVSGCATITRGKTQPLTVNSDPLGASIEISNGMTGTTPWTFELPRKDGVTITISKDGFETAVVNVVSTTSSEGGMHTAGNILFGGFIGLAVDGGSGAMKDLLPNPVFVRLVPTEGALGNSLVERGVNEPLPEVKLRSRLKELRALFEEGEINQDEYDILKAKLLSE